MCKHTHTKRHCFWCSPFLQPDDFSLWKYFLQLQLEYTITQSWPTWSFWAAAPLRNDTAHSFRILKLELDTSAAAVNNGWVDFFFLVEWCKRHFLVQSGASAKFKIWKSFFFLSFMQDNFHRKEHFNFDHLLIFDQEKFKRTKVGRFPFAIPRYQQWQSSARLNEFQRERGAQNALLFGEESKPEENLIRLVQHCVPVLNSFPLYRGTHPACREPGATSLELLC